MGPGRPGDGTAGLIVVAHGVLQRIEDRLPLDGLAWSTVHGEGRALGEREQRFQDILYFRIRLYAVLDRLIPGLQPRETFIDGQIKRVVHCSLLPDA